jgi:hypothetical protein
VNEWTKVVTSPLGLGAFALFLIFSLLSELGKSKKWRGYRWMTPVFFYLTLVTAVCCIAVGLKLAWNQSHANATATNETQKSPPQTQTLNCLATSQSSTGMANPNVNCVQGPVTINIDQSSGKKVAQTQPSQNKKADGK